MVNKNRLDKLEKLVQSQCKFSVNVLKCCGCLEEILEWNKWAPKIPYIRFDPDWEISIQPPFSGAMIRFLVRDSKGNSLSVYLDCHNVLGSKVFSLESDDVHPYWEIYPYEEDVCRVHMHDVDLLLQEIRHALKYLDDSI